MSFHRKKESPLSTVHRRENNLIIKSVLSGNRMFAENNAYSDLEDEVPNGNELLGNSRSSKNPRTHKSDLAIEEMTSDLGLGTPPPINSLPNTKIKRNYSCPKCSFFTQNPRSNLYHLKDIHDYRGNIFECNLCLYASKHAQKLQRHIRMCHAPDSPSASVHNDTLEDGQSETKSINTSDDYENEQSYQGSDNNEEEMDEDEEMADESGSWLESPVSFRCNICDDYETADKSRYNKHMKHHSSTMIKCTICDFKSPYAWNLSRHLKNHGSNGGLKCPIVVCNFSSDIQQSVQVHLQNHHLNLSDSELIESIRILKSDIETSERQTTKLARSSDSPPILVDERGLLDSSHLNFVEPDDILEKNGKIYFKKLKCSKPNCGFRAVWETDLNRHLSQSHPDPIQRKSMPTLHPISPVHGESSKLKPNQSTKPSRFLGNLSQRLQKSFNQTAVAQSNNSEGLERPVRRHSTDVIKEGKYLADMKLFKPSPEVESVSITKQNGPPEPEPVKSIVKKVYKCPHDNCSFWEATATKFHVHMIDHSDKKPFECSKCHFRSNWSWDITKHIRSKSIEDNSHLRARVLVIPGSTTDQNYTEKDYAKYLVMMSVPNLKKKVNSILNTNPLKRAAQEVNQCTLNGIDQAIIPKMPKLTRAPSRTFAGAEAELEGVTSSNGPPPPALKSINECRTFVETKMLSGGQMLLGEQQECSPMSTTNYSLGNDDLNLYGSSSIKRAKFSVEEEKLKRWKCKKCPFRHESKAAVVVHIRQFHKRDIDSSMELGTSISKPTASGETHQYTFDNETLMFGCKFCPFKTNHPSHIEGHSENHFSKPNHNYSCGKCSFSVRTQVELNEHVILHGHPRSTTSSQSQVITPEETRQKPHGAGTQGFKKYNCLACPYVTSSRGQFQYHKQFHVPKNGIHRCDKCSYNVSHKHLLHQHSRVHMAKDFEENWAESEDLEPNGSLEVFISNHNNSRRSSPEPEDHPSILVWRDGCAYKVYRCHSCPQIFEDIVDLKQHERSHLPEVKVKPSKPNAQNLPLSLCKYCPARFFNAKELVNHSNFHHHKSFFTCPNCTYSVKSIEHLESHLKVHGLDYQQRTAEVLQKSNKIRCPKCPVRCSNEPSFQNHFRFHGRISEFSCTSGCDFGADSANSLMLHELIHNVYNVNQTVVKSKMVNRKAIPVDIPDEEGKVVGTGRGRRADRGLNDEACQGNPNFTYPTYVKNGKMKEKRYKCKKCPSAFEKRDQYNVHKGLHGSNQRYVCTICEYSVTYYANFAQHLKKHETQPEISRELLMELATPISKMVHHPNAEIFRCGSCPFTADSQEDIEYHEMQHGINSTGQFPCQFCDFAAFDNEELVRHTKYHFKNVKPVLQNGVDLINQGNGEKLQFEKKYLSRNSCDETNDQDEGVSITCVDMADDELPVGIYENEDSD